MRKSTQCDTRVARVPEREQEITSRSAEGQVCVSEADSIGVATARGRQVVFSDETLHRASGYSYARHVRSRRGAQDLVYRMFAIAVVEHYCEAFPEKAPTLQWLLEPRRHSLLSELGRVAKPRSGENGELRWDERDVSLLIAVAHDVAESRPSTKDGIAIIRRLRSTGA